MSSWSRGCLSSSGGPGNVVVEVGTPRGKKQCEQRGKHRAQGGPVQPHTPQFLDGFRNPEHQLVVLVCLALAQDGPFVHSWPDSIMTLHIWICLYSTLVDDLINILLGDQSCWLEVMFPQNSDGISQLFLAFSVTKLRNHFRFLIFYVWSFSPLLAPDIFRIFFLFPVSTIMYLDIFLLLFLFDFNFLKK